MNYSNFLKLSNNLSLFFIFILPIGYIFSPGVLNVSILYIVINFLVRISIKNIKFNFKDKFFLTMIFFWLYIVLQSFFFENASFWKSFSFIRFILFPYAVYFILYNNEKIILKLKIFYLIIITFVIFDIFIQYYFGRDLLGYHVELINGYSSKMQNWREIEHWERFSGPFGYEKRAGTFLLIFGIISIFMNFKENEKLDHLKLIFLFFCFITVIITGDRSPLLIFLLFFILLIFFTFQNYNFKKIFYFFIFLIIIFFTFITFSKNSKFRYIENFQNLKISKDYDLSKNFRKIFYDNPWSALYLNSLKVFKSSPYFGTGIQSFREECKKYSVDSTYNKFSCSTHPHNIFFEIISETGLVGLSILLLSLYYLNKKYNLFKFNSSTLIFILFLSVIIPLKPSGSYFSSWFGSLIWLMIAFSSLYNRNFNK